MIRERKWEREEIGRKGERSDDINDIAKKKRQNYKK